MDLMEGVEEIPGVVLAEGLTWEWESFSDFLDALERRPRAIDVAAQVAHLPLRVYVMGDRAVRLEAARPEDIAEMRRVGLLSHPEPPNHRHRPLLRPRRKRPNDRRSCRGPEPRDEIPPSHQSSPEADTG
jgi:hypothetical protein